MLGKDFDGGVQPLKPREIVQILIAELAERFVELGSKPPEVDEGSLVIETVTARRDLDAIGVAVETSRDPEVGGQLMGRFEVSNQSDAIHLRLPDGEDLERALFRCQLPGDARSIGAAYS